MAAGVGATVELKMKQKKGTRFWDCTGVDVIEAGAGKESVTADEDEAGGKVPDDPDDPTVAANRELAEAKVKAANAAKAAKVKAAEAKAVKAKAVAAQKTAATKTTVEKIADKEEITDSVEYGDFEIREAALTNSVQLTGRILAAYAGGLKGLLKAKDTPDTLTQMTLLNASNFEAYLRGDFAKELGADNSDLSDVDVDADEPTLPGEDK
jgi:hypothetical protein